MRRIEGTATARMISPVCTPDSRGTAPIAARTVAFGVLGDDAEQSFLEVQVGSDEAEIGTDTAAGEGDENKSGAAETGMLGNLDVFLCAHQHQKEDFGEDPYTGQFLRYLVCAGFAFFKLMKAMVMTPSRVDIATFVFSFSSNQVRTMDTAMMIMVILVALGLYLSIQYPG